MGQYPMEKEGRRPIVFYLHVARQKRKTFGGLGGCLSGKGG